MNDGLVGALQAAFLAVHVDEIVDYDGNQKNQALTERLPEHIELVNDQRIAQQIHQDNSEEGAKNRTLTALDGSTADYCGRKDGQPMPASQVAVPKRVA